MSEIYWDNPEFAVYYDQNCDHQYRKGRALVEMMGITQGDVVLDVGCGTGQQAVTTSTIIGPSGSLTCIDPSTHCIELARKKFTGVSNHNVRFLVGKGENLSAIPDNSIDHAYFCSSFHWIADKNLALNEIYRVLKPGGRVGMTTLDRNSPNGGREIVKSILEKYHVRNPEWHGKMKRVTASELHDLFSCAGFTDIFIESRSTPRQYGSVEEFMKQGMELGGADQLLNDVPDDIRRKIMTEIFEELGKKMTPDGITLGIGTLFAVATKSNESM